LADTPNIAFGDLTARYELIEEAGRGGMGVVYKARDRETGDLVALKILKPEIAADEAAATRFKNEVRLARRITHKNVCRVYEFNRVGATAYLSMEFVDGESLRATLARVGSVNVRKGVQIARQICAALHEAHLQGIIHRDLKPENVMLDRAGNVKVMDFGIARSADASLTGTSGIIGTPAYMSPEQAESRPVDARTDIYAIGLILYELFTAQPAFTGDTPIQIALKHVREAAPSPRAVDPSVPIEIEQIILKCLEKDPASRFQSAEELDAALAALTAGTPMPRQVLPSAEQRTTGTAEAVPRSDDAGQAFRPAEQWPAVATPPPLAPAATRRVPRVAAAKLAAIAAALVAVVAAGWWAWDRFSVPEGGIPFRSLTLANGLKVLLSEDHSAPTVSVAVTYDVGSRDERPGRTGFAHLFEHMMFQGSLNVGKGEHFLLVRNNGGTPNGTTSVDLTTFFETLPANQLDLGLFLEADRMRSLTIDQARLENIRSAVLAERRQQYDNQPYGRAWELMNEAMFDNFAYKHSTIGSPQDLQAATLQDVGEFFKVYYAPNNAVLSLVGDFDPDEAIAKVKKYFEHIPAQPPPPEPNLDEPDQTQERRTTYEDRFAAAPVAFVGYKAPRGGTQDAAGMQLLVRILADGASSKLYQKLVKETEAATNTSWGLDIRRGPSAALFVLVPRPDRDIEQLLQQFEQVLDEVRRGGITQADLNRARMRIWRAFTFNLQQTRTRAFLLGEYQAKYGDAAMVNQAKASLDAVTVADLTRLASEYLRPTRRTVLVMTPPKARPPGARVASSAPAAVLSPTGDAAKSMPVTQVERRNRAPVSKEILRVSLPVPQEKQLDNGLTLLVAEDHRAPLVAVRLELRGAGRMYEPADQPFVARAAAATIAEGTRTRSSRQIAEQLDELGAVAGTTTIADPASVVFTASGLSETFERWFPIVADIIMNPAFPADELSIFKGRMKSQLQFDRTSPAGLADERLGVAVYGNHPAAPRRPTAATLEALTTDRLLAWHRERWVPQNAVLAIAGDIDAGRAAAKINEWLAAWKRTGASETLPPPPAPAPRALHLVDRPGSVQTTLWFGGLAVDRVHADYLPLMVAQSVLGEGEAARLFVRLREERGLTYGATSSLFAFKHAGHWRALGDMQAERSAEALDAFLAEFDRMIKEPVPETELEERKRSLVAGFARALEELPQVLNLLLMRRAYGLSTDYWDKYPEKIMAVTNQDVQRAAAKYLDPARLQIVAVGDAKMLAPILSKHGPVQMYNADGPLTPEKSSRD
jgi:zinc protease